MRLTLKLVLWFFACVVLAMGINGVIGVRGELERYESDLAARHVVMGLVMRAAFAEVMDTDGEARAVSVLDYTDKRFRHVNIRWVHLTEDAPEEHRPRTPLARLEALRSDHEVHDKMGETLYSYVPMHIEGRGISALEITESLDGERAVVRNAVLREIRTVATAALALGIATGLLGIVLVARPMRRLVEHARRIGREDLTPMRQSSGKDEIAELGREMNAMCTQLSDAQNAKLRAMEHLRRAERLSTVGKLASGLAHELGTPLNVITLRAKAVAQGRAVGEGAQDAAKIIAEQAIRMTNLVRQLLDFARRRNKEHEVVDVEEVARRTANLVETVATKAMVRFEVDVDGPLPKVRGDASQLEQVFTNLFVNAIQALPRGGNVWVAIDVANVTPPADHGGRTADFLRISVRDDGTGIAEAVLPHIFEPFFTTKDVGEGTGLGLAVCYGIARDHGGWIDVRTTLGTGTEFVVHLPKEDA